MEETGFEPRSLWPTSGTLSTKMLRQDFSSLNTLCCEYLEESGVKEPGDSI